MAVDNDYKVMTVRAGADLSGDGSKFKAITLNGTIASGPEMAAGILRHGGKSGEHVSVVYEGLTKVLAGAAISTVGYPITVTTSGYLVAATALNVSSLGTAGANAGGRSIGRALTTCASGDLVTAMVDFKSIGFFGG